MKAASELFQIFVDEFKTSTDDLEASVGFHVEVDGIFRRVQKTAGQRLLLDDGSTINPYMIGHAIPYNREIYGKREYSLIYPVHMQLPIAFEAVNGSVREFLYSKNDPHLDIIVTSILPSIRKHDFAEASRQLKSIAREMRGPRPTGNHDEQQPLGASIQAHGACCRHLVGWTYAALKIAGILAEIYCGPLLKGEKHSYLVIDDYLAVDPISVCAFPVSQLDAPYTPNTRITIEPIFSDAPGRIR